MSKRKKKKLRKRDLRKPVGTVYMFKEKVLDEKTREEVEQIAASCTCNQWRTSFAANTITKVALEAKQHVIDTDCQLRIHEADPEMTALNEYVGKSS